MIDEIPKLETGEDSAHDEQENGAADDRRLLKTTAVPIKPNHIKFNSIKLNSIKQ